MKKYKKKSVFRKWWFYLIGILFLIIILSISPYYQQVEFIKIVTEPIHDIFIGTYDLIENGINPNYKQPESPSSPLIGTEEQKCLATNGQWTQHICLCPSNSHLSNQLCMQNSCIDLNNCQFLCTNTGGQWSNNICTCRLSYQTFDNINGCYISQH